MRRLEHAKKVPTVIAAAAVAACARPPDLRQPIGHTTTSGASEPAEASGYTPPSIELYLARRAPGPCGFDQLPSISFEPGSSTLDEAQGLEVARIARCLTDKPFDQAELVLVGHADPLGSPTYNLSLAYERASNVMRRLRDLGVAPARLIVTAAAESELPRERWDEARRVDLLVTRTHRTAQGTRPPR